MRVPRCALRRAAVLRLLICLLACLRRWWRWWRWCESERVLSVPEGMAAALAAVLLLGKARSDMLLSGWLLGMHCLLACVDACALLWRAGWLAARLRLDTRVCACDRRMRSCARHAAAQRDAGCVTMACWRHMGRVWPAAGDTALLLLGGCTRTRLLVPHAGWMLRIGGAAWRRAVGARRWRVGTRATTTTAAAVTITITTTTTSTTTTTTWAGTADVVRNDAVRGGGGGGGHDDGDDDSAAAADAAAGVADADGGTGTGGELPARWMGRQNVRSRWAQRLRRARA